MKIIFLKERLDLMDAVSQSSVSDVILIPTSAKQALALVNKGLPKESIRLPIDYLSDEEKKSINNDSLLLSYSWSDTISSKCRFQDIDLADCCRVQMLAFFQDVITANRAVDKMLQYHHPETVEFDHFPMVPSFDSHAFNGNADIFEAVAQWKFEQDGVPVSIRNVSQSSKRDHQNSTAIQTPPQKLSGSNRKCIDDLSLNASYIIGFGNDFDAYVVWPYIKTLTQNTNLTPLLIHLGTRLSDPTGRSGLQVDPEIQYVVANDIPVDLEMPKGIIQLKNDLVSDLSEGKLLPKILHNPLLRFQFETLVDTFFMGAIRMVQRARYFFSKFKVKLFIEDYSAGHINRAWTEVANQLNIPNATIPHAPGVNVVEIFNFKSDYALAWGEISQKNLSLASPDRKDQIICSGSPVFESKVDIVHESRDTILILTGGFLHQVYTSFNLKRFIDAWDEIFKGMILRGNFEYVIKTHPGDRDFFSWYNAEATKHKLKNVRVVSKGNLSGYLKNVFLSVMVGSPGTAALESMRHNVPVAFLDCLAGRDIEGYGAWRDVLHTFTSPEDLYSWIDQIHLNSEMYAELLKLNETQSLRISKPFQLDMVRKTILP